MKPLQFRPATVKVLAHIQQGNVNLYFAEMIGHADRFVFTAEADGKKLSIVVDGKNAVAFAAEIRKGVEA